MYYYLLLFFTLNSIAYSQIYMGKLEPLYKNIKISEVEGELIFKNDIKEFSILKKRENIIKIEDKLNILKLNNYKKSLLIQKKIVLIKNKNYKNKLKIKQLSSYVKNSEKLLLLQAEQKQNEIQNLINIEKYQISKKVFFLKKNIYLNEIFVNKGDFIQKGKKLFDYYDFSKVKIIIFVQKKDLKSIRRHNIYIDNRKTNFYINSISKVKDDIRISTYKVILYKKNIDPIITIFDKIVKIEFK